MREEIRKKVFINRQLSFGFLITVGQSEMNQTAGVSYISGLHYVIFYTFILHTAIPQSNFANGKAGIYKARSGTCSRSQPYKSA